MYRWIKQINWKKSLIAALVYTVVSLGVRQLEAAFTLDYYTNPDYFDLWSNLMMPEAGPPPANFLLVSLLFAFFTGLVMTALYQLLLPKLSKSFWRRVLEFTDIVIGLFLVLSFMPMYLLLNLPFGLLLSWFVSNAAIVFLSTIGFAKLLK